jgi:hypothetical protein
MTAPSPPYATRWATLSDTADGSGALLREDIQKIATM